MQIKLWKNFSKRAKSTKQPADASAVIIQAKLKEATSVEAPTFTILGNDTDYNYAYAFGQYYTIEDTIQNTNGTCDIVCSKDLLATWKSNIGAYTGFMEYSSSSNRLNILDVRNTPTDNWNATYNPIDFATNPFNATGVYILGVLNNSGHGANGAVCYYYMSSGNMSRFQQVMFDHDFIQNIVQEFTGSASSLVSCIWLPINYDVLAGILGASETVRVGSYSMEGLTIGVSAVKGQPLTGRHLHVSNTTATLTFPSQAYYLQTGFTYLDKAPYTTAVLYLPFVGCVPLDLDIFALHRRITISADIDVLSGDIVYTVYEAAGQITSKCATYSGNLATHIPLSSASYDSMGVLTGTVSTVGGAITSIIGAAGAFAAGNAALGASTIGAGALHTASGALSTAKSFELHTMVNGSISSAVSAHIGLYPTVMIFTAEPAETNLLAFRQESGMPVFAVETIGSQSGYVKMRDADIPIASHGADRSALNNLVNSGFYYE